MQKFRRAIYLMQSIEGVAGALVGVFIPIYILTLGFSVKQLFIFLIINSIGIVFFFFLTAYLVNRLGVKKILALRLLFLFIKFYFLLNLTNNHWSLYLIALFNSLELAFYWFSLHVIFAKSAEENKIGKSVSKLMAIPNLVKLAVPLMGAGISVLFGFQALFWLAALFHFLAILPLNFSESIKIEVKISWREIWYFFKKYKKYVGLEIFLGIIGEIENYILPIFLFLTFNNVLSIGFLASLLAAGSALFTLLIGRIIDKVDKNKFLRIGVMVMLIVFIGRYFAITQIQFYILSVCAGFFGVLISLPFNSIVYQNARQNKVENFIVFREIPIAFGRLLIYSCALLLISKIKLTFLLAALSYLLILFL